MKIQAGRHYKTRDGQTAKIAAMDSRMAPGEQAVGWLRDQCCAWTPEGFFLSDLWPHPSDLVAELHDDPKHAAGWVLINPNEIFSNREEALDFAQTHHRPVTACVKVDVPEGEGL